ncbi:MAG: hypothetical protein K6T85_14325 [Gorillibacterium sp.]|nr:hypothetical protein [Gorillibacterium sp.]
MDQLERYKDILFSEMTLQTFLNNEMIRMTNPVARQTFSAMRDEDAIHIILLQQIIESIESPKEPVLILSPKE